MEIVEFSQCKLRTDLSCAIIENLEEECRAQYCWLIGLRHLHRWMTDKLAWRSNVHERPKIPCLNSKYGVMMLHNDR